MSRPRRRATTKRVHKSVYLSQEEVDFILKAAELNDMSFTGMIVAAMQLRKHMREHDYYTTITNIGVPTIAPPTVQPVQPQPEDYILDYSSDPDNTDDILY